MRSAYSAVDPLVEVAVGAYASPWSRLHGLHPYAGVCSSRSAVAVVPAVEVAVLLLACCRLRTFVVT